VRKGSKTSSFGTPARESHDASTFYAQRLYEHVPQNATKPDNFSSGENAPGSTDVVWQDGEAPFNRIYRGDSRWMAELPDDSVHLMVTSPPYNVGKDYDENLSLEEYLTLLRQVFNETYRVLAPGGRACVNIANLGRRPYIPLHAYIIADMIDIGYLMRGEIIWDKGAGAGVSCAWGSFASASNPVLRDVHEYILVFSKGDFKREKGNKENTISNEDFVAWTKSVWQMGTESAKKVGHPAPFPVELPRRLIELYTFVDDIVLDPFCGSGTTCVAAALNKRRYVGYDISPEYAQLAAKRLEVLKRETRQGGLPFS
jgi:DNA modification methylase